MRKNMIFSILTVMILTILSCKNGKKDELEIKKVTEQKPSQFPKTEKITTTQIHRQDSLDITFIGKTTQELDKFNFHECFGVMIEGKSETEKYAVSESSLNIDNCRNGKSKIFLGKFRNYYDQGKANFEIKDELIVNSNYPKKCYSDVVLKLAKDRSEKNYLIEYEDNSKPLLTKI